MVLILDQGIQASTPIVRPSKYMKYGFTEDCKEAQMTAKRLKRHMRQTGDYADIEAFRVARNYKSNLIRRARRKSFREYIAKVCETPKVMWKGTKFSRDI